jgi:hypothetical protein
MDRLEEQVDQMDETKENIKPALQATTPTTQSISKISHTAVTQQSQSQRHWSVGRPLETLMEVDDQESETRTTPGTLKGSTSMTPNSTDASKRSSTSPTSLVANAPASESKKRQDMNKTKGSKHFDQSEAQHDISTSIGEKHAAFSTSQLQHTDMHSNGLSKNSANIILAASRADEHDSRTDRSQQYADEDADGSALDLDDSALYCPTIIASERKQQQRRLNQQQQQQIDPFYGMASQSPSPSKPFDRHRISHVDVPMMVASPAPTVFTMDMSTLGSSWWQNDSLLNEEDFQSVASEETPVLNRYRVDNDDCSPHGYVVVPNQRGTHRSSRRLTAQTSNKAPKSVIINIPQSNASASKQIFRKTPFRPATRPFLPSTPTIEEHKPLRERAGHDLLDQYDLDEESLLLSPASSPEKNVSSQLMAASAAENCSGNKAMVVATPTDNKTVFVPPSDIDISFLHSEYNVRGH